MPTLLNKIDDLRDKIIKLNDIDADFINIEFDKIFTEIHTLIDKQAMDNVIDAIYTRIDNLVKGLLFYRKSSQFESWTLEELYEKKERLNHMLITLDKLGVKDESNT